MGKKSLGYGRWIEEEGSGIGLSSITSNDATKKKSPWKNEEQSRIDSDTGGIGESSKT